MAGKKKPADPVLKELNDVKKLLVLLLLKLGATQDEIGLALQLNKSNVSRLLPASKVKIFRNDPIKGL